MTLKLFYQQYIQYTTASFVQLAFLGLRSIPLSQTPHPSADPGSSRQTALHALAALRAAAHSLVGGCRDGGRQASQVQMPTLRPPACNPGQATNPPPASVSSGTERR